MDDKELREMKRLVQENNKMLHNLQARARWSTFGTILKWVIYIAIAVVSWYYIQPFIDQTLQSISKIQEASDSVKGIQAKVDGVDFDSVKAMLGR